MLISRPLRGFLPALMLTLVAFLSPPSTAETAGWETVGNPETHKGLVISPRLLHIRGRIMMFWGGTSLEAKAPELFFASRGEGDDSWSVELRFSELTWGGSATSPWLPLAT